jgi:hypothetical protein
MAHTERDELLAKLNEYQGEAINERTEEIMLIRRIGEGDEGVSVFLSAGTNEIPADLMMRMSEQKGVYDDMKTAVRGGDKYRHTKSGGEYVIVAVGFNVVTGEMAVAYKELQHEPAITWIRSYNGTDGWTVPTEIDGQTVPRFTLVS